MARCVVIFCSCYGIRRKEEFSALPVEPNGRRRALLIGINYPNSEAPLQGCWNDVKDIENFIRDYGFEDIRVLTDEDDSPEWPTRDNMLDAMEWLVEDVQPGDSLFFHFSGHGSQQQDLSGDEEDGLDETLQPCDFEEAGDIVDDDLFEILVRPLAEGAKLTAILDCCHSGSALDLHYQYGCEGVRQFPGDQTGDYKKKKKKDKKKDKKYKKGKKGKKKEKKEKKTKSRSGGYKEEEEEFYDDYEEEGYGSDNYEEEEGWDED